MAILPMRRISIYGLRHDRKAILETLQRRGVVEITDTKLKDYDAVKPDTAALQATFLKGMTNAENALSILSGYVPEDSSLFSMFEGKKSLSVDDYYTFVNETEEIMRIALRVNSLSKEISEKKAEIIRCETQLDALTPWTNLDVPISFRGTKKAAAFIGTFPEEQTLDDILASYSSLLESQKLDADKFAVDVQIISSSPEQTCVFILCYRPSAEKVEDLLRTLGFAKPTFAPNTSPYEYAEQIKKTISDINQSINDKENEIMSYVGMRNAFKFMSDYYSMRADKYKVLSHSNHFKRTFMLTGFVPEKDSGKLEEELSFYYDAAVETEPVSDEDDVPILLQNNAFAAPMETVLETYSLPGKGEIDPCTMMAVFYYLLFGLMLSDAAYGLIMVIACGFLLAKFKNMASGLKKSMQMFLYCGISTTFWGLMFGGFFGDAVNVVSSTFFGKEIVFPTLWFAPINEPMKMLMFSFGLGIVHLFAGLGVQFYQLCKQKKYKDAIYDVVFWYLLVGGAIVYLMSTQMFIDMANLPFKIPALGANIAVGCAAVGAVGIILTGGRESVNPFKRLAKGLYALYNVTGYLSDILSYSRLLALGLATGVIAQVFNKMGSMMGNGVGGAIAFTLVFLIGHSINLGINLLGAYVHTNRLQFVEFFGKFYEGGGRKYSPFSENTKYFKIEEEV